MAPFSFKTHKLRNLYTQEKGARRFPPEVVTAFFRAMAEIRSAEGIGDIRALKSRRFETVSYTHLRAHET